MKLKIKKNGEVLSVPTSSMGDIAFLLIIFFLLTSKFMQESHVECEMPGSPDVQKIADEPVSVMLDKEGALWLQGQSITPEELKNKVEELKGDDKDFTVMFKVHRELTAKQYSNVIKKLAESGAKVAFVGEASTSYQE